MQVNTIQATDLIIDCAKAGLVPMLAGSPGTGKSSIVHKIAEEFNLKVIDMRLSQCDPTDLLGLPMINKETGKSSYMPMDTFPLEHDAIPAGKDGWLLFLDEFNSAPLSVQAAAYKLVLDRAVGLHKLHEKVVIVCAGNLDTDNAIVNRMSTAMQSRLIHLELSVDHEAWLAWANAEGNIDYRITSYINFKPDNLYKFHPDHNDKTFACARTWEFVSKLIKDWSDIPVSKIPLLAGTISEGVAREFIGFCKIFQDLPTIQEIEANPTGIKMPEEPSTQYALSGSIANHTTEANIDQLSKFVNRMPIEFQVITLQDMLKRNNKLVSAKPIKEWVKQNAQELF